MSDPGDGVRRGGFASDARTAERASERALERVEVLVRDGGVLVGVVCALLVCALVCVLLVSGWESLVWVPAWVAVWPRLRV